MLNEARALPPRVYFFSRALFGEVNRPSARTTSALPRHNGRRRSLRFIHATYTRARACTFVLVSLSWLFPLFVSFSRLLSVSACPSPSLSFSQSSSLCVFSRFSIVSGINAPHDRPRYAEKNPSSSRSARLAVASWRTYRYLLVGGTLCAARQRPAPRVPRRPFARSIFTRFSDAGNYITPESDSLDARAREMPPSSSSTAWHAARSSCLARIHLVVMNLRIFRLASSVSAFFLSLPPPSFFF